ncbi:MAG: DUF402 domain-containing protein [Mycoplasmataceae bacterium]|nr:DUF402 domain-containing protein [Mycoplasmataceae bacterium]
MNIDKKMQIHAYKFNGVLYRTWEFPTIIEETNDYICLDLFNTHVITTNDKTERFFHSKLNRPTIWYFFKNEWYNMIVSKKGKKYYYYINIASPFLIEEDVIKYIDFDLDYRIPDARSAKINLLDVDEFNEHQIKYKYPKNLVDKLNQVKHEILEKFKQKKFDQYLNYALIYKRSNEVNHDKTK